MVVAATLSAVVPKLWVTVTLLASHRGILKSKVDRMEFIKVNDFFLLDIKSPFVKDNVKN